MKQKLTLLPGLVLLFCLSLSAQVPMAPKKALDACRIFTPVHIDGRLDEPFWQETAEAEGFLHQWPTPGLPATEKTVVRIVYDDHAVYIGAYLYDSRPDSIYHRLSKRDELENTDWFSVTFDAYQDGQNALQFGISPDNVQFDIKYSLANANSDNGNADGEDPAWDAVWYSAASIAEDGWIAEIEIPYSALRFPKKTTQRWNLNFHRRIERRGETDCWNEIKAEITGSLNQMGLLTGVEGVKAPLRLSVTPFVAAYADNLYNQNASPSSSWNFPFSAGMDLKYGINQAFTLDATIVPDFGQVRTDNYVLNLSPFEVRFAENRPFFTEGTELFNKGNFFYSRRIGAQPLHYWDVYDQIDENNEEVVQNPGRVQLLNATKLSGRTQSGLGVGVFNAMEAATHAIVNNLETGARREIETSPFTNRNVFVLDQNLKNNSSVTLINTSVLRSGADRDANVTGLLFKLKNKAQSYALDGKAAYSARLTPAGNDDGYTGYLNIEKTNGNFLWGANCNIESDRYDPRDLGFLHSANEKSGTVWINYSRYKPLGFLNNFWSSAWSYTERLYRPDVWVATAVGLNFGGNTKQFQNFGVNMNVRPVGVNDYFEPRTDDFSTFYHVPASANIGFRYNSDNRKKWLFSLNGGGRLFKQHQRKSSFLNADIRWRATSRLSLNLGTGLEEAWNNEGWTWSDEASQGYEALAEDAILIGRRRLETIENTLSVVYSFSPTINLNVYSRHYWQKVEYNDFFNLGPGGKLEDSPYLGRDFSGNALNDITANYFNVDVVFTWRFAPGSDILLVYKNNIFNDDIGPIRPGYFRNAGDLSTFPGSNSFSIKVLYFLDYERVHGRI